MVPTLVAIVGESGTGKTTSIRNLPPESTYIIRLLNKIPPVKGWKSKYKEGVNTSLAKDWMDVINTIKEVNKDPKYKVLVIDDLGALMSDEFLSRASESGFNKFTEIGQHMFYVLKAAQKCREDLIVFCIFHPETTTDVFGRTGRKIRTIGKILDEKYTLEGIFSIILYTKVEQDDSKRDYKFVTNWIEGYPAKSPLGMFPDLYIENDLAKVTEYIRSWEQDSE